MHTICPNIKQVVYLGHSGATYGKASKCSIGLIVAHGLKKGYIDGLVQGCSKPSASAME